MHLIRVNSVRITYLQPGHTQYMSVDFVHSAIDSNFKKKNVWATSEWSTIIVNSRNKPKPYTDDGRKIKISEIKQKFYFPKILQPFLDGIFMNQIQKKNMLQLLNLRRTEDPQQLNINY